MDFRRERRRQSERAPTHGQVDLSSLGLDELERLLRLALARGQKGLAEQLLREVEARGGEVPPRPATAPRAADRLARIAPRAAVVAAAAILGAGLAWTLAASWGKPRKPEPPPRAMVVRAATPAVRAVASAPPEPQPAPAPVSGVAARPVARPPHAHNSCLDLPSPGERLVCGYPSLTRQDRRLADAYADALQAAEDPVGLAAAQADWREARNAIGDRRTLTAFYAARIDELEAEAAGRSAPP
jgi:hypothetical protein